MQVPPVTRSRSFPQRPSIGLLPLKATLGSPLSLPARTGFVDLSEADYVAAAKTLGCETRMIRAMAKKEGKDHGFDELNSPVILFEPLHFKKLSPQGKGYGKEHFYLTHLHPKPHRYGSTSDQWQRLQEAYLLNPDAALEVVSWGKFQILGSNHGSAGYATAQTFVSAMCGSEQNHLNAFVSLIKSWHLQPAFAAKDWSSIARVYNGPNFGTYDTDLKDIYDQLED